MNTSLKLRLNGCMECRGFIIEKFMSNPADLASPIHSPNHTMLTTTKYTLQTNHTIPTIPTLGNLGSLGSPSQPPYDTISGLTSLVTTQGSRDGPPYHTTAAYSTIPCHTTAAYHTMLPYHTTAAYQKNSSAVYSRIFYHTIPYRRSKHTFAQTKQNKIFLQTKNNPKLPQEKI